MKKLIFTVCILIAGLSLSAQTSEGGLTVGTTFYMGDLNPSPIMGKPMPAIGGLYKYNLTPHLSLRANLLFGYLQDDDKNHDDNYYIKTRDLNFRTYIFEGSAVAEFNILRYIPGSKRNSFKNVKRNINGYLKATHNWTPYIFVGIGAMTFNPKGYYHDEDGEKKWIALRPLSTEGESMKYYQEDTYSRVQVVFPVGIGAKMMVNKKLQMGLEWSYRFTLTDYLDDVSKTYPDPVDLLADKGPLAVQMSSPHGQTGMRGNPDNNDYYGYIGVTATWFIHPDTFKIFKGACKSK